MFEVVIRPIPIQPDIHIDTHTVRTAYPSINNTDEYQYSCGTTLVCQDSLSKMCVYYRSGHTLIEHSFLFSEDRQSNYKVFPIMTRVWPYSRQSMGTKTYLHLRGIRAFHHEYNQAQDSSLQSYSQKLWDIFYNSIRKDLPLEIPDLDIRNCELAQERDNCLEAMMGFNRIVNSWTDDIYTSYRNELDIRPEHFDERQIEMHVLPNVSHELSVNCFFNDMMRWDYATKDQLHSYLSKHGSINYDTELPQRIHSLMSIQPTIDITEYGLYPELLKIYQLFVNSSVNNIAVRYSLKRTYGWQLLPGYYVGNKFFTHDPSFEQDFIGRLEEILHYPETSRPFLSDMVEDGYAYLHDNCEADSEEAYNALSIGDYGITDIEILGEMGTICIVLYVTVGSSIVSKFVAVMDLHLLGTVSQTLCEG